MGVGWGCLERIPVFVHLARLSRLQTGKAMVGQVSTEKPLSLAWIQDPTWVRLVWSWLLPDSVQPWVSVLPHQPVCSVSAYCSDCSVTWAVSAFH